VTDQNVSFLWQDPDRVSPFRTGICLHGHTLHSEEHLGFLPRYLSHIPGASRIAAGVDFARAFFRPPLTPASAFHLERKQIAGLDLRPLVSLTDHDSIEAGVELRKLEGGSNAPVSVEWTAPYYGSIFHLGIHNLPPASAGSWTSTMATYTAAPDEKRLPEILSGLAGIPDLLVVLNHPFWLEEGVEETVHRAALKRLLCECVAWLHAFELNGTRRWTENAEAIELARAYSRPVISGGDRHACEPAACLNLTNAESFPEFVSEIREGKSSILFMPHYRQAMALRLFEAVCDILRAYPEYPGRARWMDRFFYRCDDGSVQSLTALWRDREPWVLRPATGTLQFLATTGMRGVLRTCFARQAEVLQ
jgi:hypothetical protein